MFDNLCKEGDEMKKIVPYLLKDGIGLVVFSVDLTGDMIVYGEKLKIITQEDVEKIIKDKLRDELTYRLGDGIFLDYLDINELVDELYFKIPEDEKLSLAHIDVFDNDVPREFQVDGKVYYLKTVEMGYIDDFEILDGDMKALNVYYMYFDNAVLTIDDILQLDDVDIHEKLYEYVVKSLN